MLLREQFDIVKQMIDDNEYLLESLRDNYNRTLLMNVALQRLSFSPFKFLIEFPQDFSTVDFNERNIIHFIVLDVYDDDDGRLMMLKSLRDEITRETFARLINHLDVVGDSPLHDAALPNHHNTIKFLIQNGANVNVRNERGELPEEQEQGCNNETKQLIQSYRN